MRCNAMWFDAIPDDEYQKNSSQFLPGDQHERNGSVASWDPQQQPTSFRQSSFHLQTFPFLRPFCKSIMGCGRGQMMESSGGMMLLVSIGGNLAKVMVSWLMFVVD